jgi:hypothetical protein
LDVDDEIHRLRLPHGIPRVERVEVFESKVSLDTHPGVITRHVVYSQNKHMFKNKKMIKKHNLVHYALECVFAS